MKRFLVLLPLLLVSQPSLAQFLDLPKAIVQFDGEPKSGSYVVQSPGTVTVTTNTPYNFRVGDSVYLDLAPVGDDRGDVYKPIIAVNGGSFTVQHTPTSSSGGASVMVWVKLQKNIAQVSHRYKVIDLSPIRLAPETGKYEIYFVTPFADEQYAAIGGGRYWAIEDAPTASRFSVQYLTYGGNAKNMDYAAWTFYGLQAGETP